MGFLLHLRHRNKLLYYFGFYNLLLALICIALLLADDQQILGINRWIKPLKFFLSVWIMAWTMAILLFYLNAKKQVKTISWLIVISMFVENFIIMLQAYRMERSHFNIQQPVNSILFGLMGIFIIIFTITTAWILILFLKQKNFDIPDGYLFAVRFGIFCFLIFSLEGGLMLSNMGHTIGAVDGGPGMPLINWSTQHGDLRIAHFFGIHTLQILPLSGWYVFKIKRSLMAFSIVYFVAVSTMLIFAYLK